MTYSPTQQEFELICVVVNHGLGSKIIKAARQQGVPGATVCLGKGTVKRSRILELLELTDVRKEIVFMVSDRETAYRALEELDREFQFEKPNHGIAFTTSVKRFIRSGSHGYDEVTESRGADKTMHSVIFVVVDRGKGEEVIDAATAAGSKGGTIIHGRGSGIHEASMVFAMPIEPEKEIVMILSENELVDRIVTSIREHLKIDEPGNGIIFVQDVNKTYGLR